MPAKINSAVCQEKLSISACASGENRNWPNEPAAVPAPNAKRAPVFRHELAERADHHRERAAGKAKADQHAGREIEHQRRGARAPSRQARSRRGWRRRTARAPGRSDRQSLRRTAAPRPRAGSAARSQTRTPRGPSRVRTTSATGTGRAPSAGRRRSARSRSRPRSARPAFARGQASMAQARSSMTLRSPGIPAPDSARGRSAYLVA